MKVNKTMKVVAIVAVMAILCAVLVACVPSSPDKAKERLEKEGYTAVVVKKDDSTFATTVANILPGMEGVEAVVVGSKLVVPRVFAIYFESTSAAKDAFAKLGDKDSSDGHIEQKGKVIIMGMTDDDMAVLK